jgi:hypothetical protein
MLNCLWVKMQCCVNSVQSCLQNYLICSRFSSSFWDKFRDLKITIFIGKDLLMDESTWKAHKPFIRKIDGICNTAIHNPVLWPLNEKKSFENDSKFTEKVKNIWYLWEFEKVNNKERSLFEIVVNVENKYCSSWNSFWVNRMHNSLLLWIFEKVKRVYKERARAQNHEKDIRMWIKHTSEHETNSRQQSDESLRGWENAQPWYHDHEKINRRSVEHQNSPWNSILASMFHRSLISKSEPSLFLHLHLIPTLHR